MWICIISVNGTDSVGRQLILGLGRHGFSLPIITITAAILSKEGGGQLKEAGADAVLAQPLNDHSFAAEILDPAAKKRL